MEKKEKWTFEGESFEESLLIFGRMLADEVRRSGLRAYLPRGYILVVSPLASQAAGSAQGPWASL